MPTLADIIAQASGEAVAKALQQDEQLLKDVAKAGGDAASNGLLGDVKDVTTILTNLFGDIPLIGGLLQDVANPVKMVEDGAGKFGTGFGLGWVVGSLVWSLIQPVILPLQHEANSLTTNQIFDAQTAAQLSTRGIISEDFARSEASGNGFDSQHENWMIEAAKVYPTLSDALALLNRGEITEDDVRLFLTREGVPDVYHDRLISLRETLLSPADLALATLRGFITLDAARQQAAKVGTSESEFDVLIANTGEPPGPMQLMEALRRGFIDQARFERGIRQSRVRDEWIDVENKLAYSPMSTADAIRAVVEGYFTSDEGKAIAVQNGLETNHWDVLVQSWGRPLSHEQMMQLYYRGQASLDEVRQAFRESDLKNKYIDQAIELARRLVPERTVVMMLHHGVIDRPRAVQMLLELGFAEADANALIALGDAERTSAAKHLTRTDILGAYAEGVMNNAEAVKHLTSLGYTEADARELLQLQDAKAATATRKATIKGIEASFRSHHLTREAAITQLITAGLDHQQAAIMLDEWQQLRGVPTRVLSESQVVHLATAKLITPNDAYNRLMAWGLSSEDARLWLSYEGVLTPQTNPTAIVPRK